MIRLARALSRSSKATTGELVRVHVSRRDVEPPPSQAQTPLRHSLPHDAVRHQMAQLDQDIELRKLIVARQGRVERPFVIQPAAGTAGVMQPPGEVGGVRPDLLCQRGLHRAAG